MKGVEDDNGSKYLKTDENLSLFENITQCG